MTTLPKWTEDRTAELNAAVAGESPVSRATVANLAEKFGTSSRSVSAKLRKEGHEVENATAAPKAFSAEEADALADFVTSNSGSYTYAEVAANFADGKFTAKQIQGKVLSLELTSHIRPTPKAEVVKAYTPEQEARIIEMVNANSFVEDIAAAMGKDVASIRGKALSLLRSGAITAMPAQREVKGSAPDAFEALGDVSNLTVAEIATKLDKSERGVKTMLTRRGVVAKDYDGAAKAAKAAA